VRWLSFLSLSGQFTKSKKLNIKVGKKVNLKIVWDFGFKFKRRLDRSSWQIIIALDPEEFFREIKRSETFR
jgi:hypothetical protein